MIPCPRANRMSVVWFRGGASRRPYGARKAWSGCCPRVALRFTLGYFPSLPSRGKRRLVLSLATNGSNWKNKCRRKCVAVLRQAERSPGGAVAAGGVCGEASAGGPGGAGAAPFWRSSAAFSNSSSCRAFSAAASASVTYWNICTRPGYCSVVKTRFCLSMATPSAP